MPEWAAINPRCSTVRILRCPTIHIVSGHSTSRNAFRPIYPAIMLHRIVEHLATLHLIEPFLDLGIATRPAAHMVKYRHHPGRPPKGSIWSPLFGDDGRARGVPTAATARSGAATYTLHRQTPSHPPSIFPCSHRPQRPVSIAKRRKRQERRGPKFRVREESLQHRGRNVVQTVT